MPPLYIGAFDAQKIAFVPYAKISDIFIQNDFNWKVAPSDHKTKEFKMVFDRVKRIYTILPQIDGVEGTIKYIDLSWDKVNYLKMQGKKPEQKEEESSKEKKKNEIRR